jgi:arylsulfatase A-like enzyme
MINIIVIAGCLFYSCAEPQADKRPNILLILADDLGFSDLGCFGSEIATPNIDHLAEGGHVFINFYTAATCSPTRAMLLSGTDNHIAGLGNMAERVPSIPAQAGKPGYEGHLNERVVSVAQLLKDAGYHTYMAGKWHLGKTPEQAPAAKGFERSFALLDAYANHFNPDTRVHRFWEDDDFGEYPAGAYSSDFYTDKMISFIKEDRRDDKPFFLYAAYTSPHWPLQAPQEFIEKYRGVYDIGYDSLRSLRFNALKKKGIVPANIALPELPAVKGNLYTISDKPLLLWNRLGKNEQKIEARKMEIYAAMVENMDYNIGRLIGYLKEIGEYENTFIVFLSDNGPDVFELNETPPNVDPFQYMGTADSFVAYGPQWAHASSAVNRLYKGYSSEGGIRSPMIIRAPLLNKYNGMTNSFSTVMDLAPTFLELAGASYPSSYKGREIAPYKGTSLITFLNNKAPQVHKEDYVMGWELFGRCALRKGKWKITKIEPPFGKSVFELFNLEEDPSESHDLSDRYPDKYREMLAEWEHYVNDNGVILADE